MPYAARIRPQSSTELAGRGAGVGQSSVRIAATSGTRSQPGSLTPAWAKISRAKPHQLTAGAPQ